MITKINEFRRINEDISMKTFYHGTDKSFDSFELSKPIKNKVYNAPDDNGIGIFFTDNQIMAGWFAGLTEYDPDKERYVQTKKKGRIIKADLHIANPFIINPEDGNDGFQTYIEMIERYKGPARFKDALLKRGHDGILVTGCDTNYYEDGSYDIAIVFDPKQITIK